MKWNPTPEQVEELIEAARNRHTAGGLTGHSPLCPGPELYALRNDCRCGAIRLWKAVTSIPRAFPQVGDYLEDTNSPFGPQTRYGWVQEVYPHGLVRLCNTENGAHSALPPTGRIWWTADPKNCIVVDVPDRTFGYTNRKEE